MADASAGTAAALALDQVAGVTEEPAKTWTHIHDLSATALQHCLEKPRIVEQEQRCNAPSDIGSDGQEPAKGTVKRPTTPDLRLSVCKQIAIC